MVNKINEILSDDHIKSIKEMSYHIAVVQKLNEELTAENARLLEELEKQKPFTALENNLPKLLSEIERFRSNQNIIDDYDRKTQRILTLGVIVIFSLAVLTILYGWYLKHC